MLFINKCCKREYKGGRTYRRGERMQGEAGDQDQGE